jgi:nicotinamide mononucleotide transporter
MPWVELQTLAEISALFLGLGFPIAVGLGFRIGWVLGGFSAILNGIIAGMSGYYMDLALNVFYLFISVITYLGWEKKEIEFKQMGIKNIVFWLGFPLLPTLLYSLVSPYIPGANWGFADGLTTFYSLAATYLLGQKIRWAWLIFIPINAMSAGMYFLRDYPIFALQFVVLSFLALWAYRRWETKH